MKFNRIANLTNHQLTERFISEVERYLMTMKDGPVRVQISRYKRTRSSQANRYYWGVVIRLIAEYTGYTDDEVHAMLKMMFLRKRADGMPETVMSTSKLPTDKFEEYLETIRRWAAVDLGVFIPDPNQEVI